MNNFSRNLLKMKIFIEIVITKFAEDLEMLLLVNKNYNIKIHIIGKIFHKKCFTHKIYNRRFNK